MYLYKTADENAIDIDAPIGRMARLHNRAYGKAILAYLDESRIKTILDEHGLPQTSAWTITDREMLFNELKQIRSQGFTTNLQSLLKGSTDSSPQSLITTVRSWMGSVSPVRRNDWR